MVRLRTNLHSVKPVLRDWQSSYRRHRKDKIVLCCARIDHTHLTYSYMLKKDPPPPCEHCQHILTVRHILVVCNNVSEKMKDIFSTSDAVESFRHIITHYKQTISTNCFRHWIHL